MIIFRKISLQLFIVFTLCFYVFRVEAIPSTPYSREELLGMSSLVVGEDCPAKRGPLYRGVSGIFFSPLRIVKNLLIDHSDEHISWGFSKALAEKTNGGGSSSDFYMTVFSELVNLQEQIIEENYQNKPCKLVEESSKHTFMNKELSEKLSLGSLGIAATSNSSYARKYAIMAAGKESPLQLATVLKIEERTPRAGFFFLDNDKRGLLDKEADLDEWFIPIIIPAEDITAAWYSDIYFERQIQGGTIVIDIRKSNLISIVNDLPLITNGDGLARIVECPLADRRCKSATSLKHPVLKDLAEALRKNKVNGKKYRLEFFH